MGLIHVNATNNHGQHELIVCSAEKKNNILAFDTFSAFWLRSSVVSVLISLISDTDLIEIEDIKLIFDVARIASGLPVLSVTGCLCIAVSQSTADPARGFPQGKKNS